MPGQRFFKRDVCEKTSNLGADVSANFGGGTPDLVAEFRTPVNQGGVALFRRRSGGDKPRPYEDRRL